MRLLINSLASLSVGSGSCIGHVWTTRLPLVTHSLFFPCGEVKVISPGLSSPHRPDCQLTSPEVVLKRLRALSTNGPLFALSFLAFWVAWAGPGLQFLLCLCLYDGFLTMVDLHHSALLADLAVSAADRTRLNFHCSLFSALGSASVFLSYCVWDKEDFYSFRLFCVTLAAFSILGFVVVSRLLQSLFQKDICPRQDEAQMLKE